jgi:hypothetical protein
MAPTDSQFADQVFMAWRSPTRHYRGVVQLNLFGEWELFRVWGGNGSLRGGCLVQPVATREEGLLELQRVDRHRVSRGYTRVAEQPPA